MKRREFLGSIGAFIGATAFSESDVSKKMHETLLQKEIQSELDEKRKKMKKINDQKKLTQKNEHTQQFEQKEHSFAQINVLKTEFENILELISDETKNILEKFYQNKHTQTKCPDIASLLQKEWKRISEKELDHLMKARFGNDDKVLARYLNQFTKNLPELLSSVKKAGQETGVPTWLILGIIGIESGGNPRAKNTESGAAGLMQIIPDTARKVLHLRVDIEHGIDERLDIDKSIHAGARYLALLYKRFGQWSLALTAYAGGGGQLRGRIKNAYRSVGLKIPETKQTESLQKNGVNIITLYSKEFCALGKKHSIQYPFFVESMAQMIYEQILKSDERLKLLEPT